MNVIIPLSLWISCLCSLTLPQHQTAFASKAATCIRNSNSIDRSILPLAQISD